MSSFFEKVIEALRAEMEEYGGLLHLFQEQQQRVLRHDPEGFLELNEAVEAQIGEVTRARRQREELVRVAAGEVGEDPGTPLSGLFGHCPEAQRPLLKALVQEINDLLYRTQKRLRQNHMLLKQCVELARQMVSFSRPEVATGAYNAMGKRSASGNGVHSLQGMVA